MMEEDLEARLLGQRSMSPRALDDSMQRMYGQGMQQQPPSPASTPSMGPPLRDMRKKRRTPDIAAPAGDGAPTSSHSRSSSTASSPGSLSPREPLSPRSSSPSFPSTAADAGNPFDDPKPALAQKTASPAHKATALPPSPSTTTSSMTTAAGAGGASQQQQRSAEPRPVEVAKPAQTEGAAVEAGDDSEEDQEGKQRRAGARMRDEEALSSLRTRMERYWMILPARTRDLLS